MARNADEQEQFNEAEELRSRQEQFDPAVHGVGTVSPVAPGSVTEMYKLHKDLADRFEEIEHGASTVVSGVLNSLISRIEQMEKKLASMGQAAVDAVQGATRLSGMGIDAPPSNRQEEAPQTTQNPPPSPFRHSKTKLEE